MNKNPIKLISILIILSSIIIFLFLLKKDDIKNNQDIVIISPIEILPVKNINVNSIEYLTDMAEKGNITSQLTLANNYASGLKTDKDMKKAVKWYKKAAEQENPEAIFKLGMAYSTGDGIEKDEFMAKLLIEKAAKMGNVQAQSMLGFLYYYMEDNVVEAFTWMTIAQRQIPNIFTLDQEKLYKELTNSLSSDEMFEAMDKSKQYYSEFVEELPVR